ncbi:MAG: ImmA/IrrE family metallo-endopeptidase, partial [Pseudomonadota bacterium]|nr:ImmA/IrrE family metallo-endopeptidase [Pseudomonadota bacterium]
SLSIVELNVQRFDASDWTDRIRASRDDLLTKLDQLTAEARKRLASQIDQSERKTAFSRDLQDITVVMKGKRAMPEAAIEAIAIRLQRALWTNRDWLWKDRAPPSEFDILDPDKALSCFGLLVHHATTLGQHFSKGTMYEVAGQIDQPAKVVSISKQIQPETRSFTTAHELGHYLLHTQPLLHRDRPLNGVRVTEPRDSEEWQADKFASYFLMPRKLLIKTFMRLFLTENFRITEQTAFALNEPSVRDLRNQCKNIRGLARLLARATAYNGVHFHSLSDRFKVSVEAMAIRLEELELVSY